MPNTTHPAPARRYFKAAHCDHFLSKTLGITAQPTINVPHGYRLNSYRFFYYSKKTTQIIFYCKKFYPQGLAHGSFFGCGIFDGLYIGGLVWVGLCQFLVFNCFLCDFLISFCCAAIGVASKKI
jgi:hypothetical protein